MDEIKALRDKTGISVMQCKKALEEAGGDQDKALAILRQKGSEAAAKKSDRQLGSGAIAAYIHNNHAVGAMAELSCETDFVSKNEEFTALAHDLAMHITALSPTDVNDLLLQSFVKDDSRTVKDVIDGAIQKFGERIEVRRFARFSTNE